ncbi:hypothetical protein [Phaeacidiphilus oryzae]|uniref:hypothetical protein n=1 Tax=Phaeacidiphilus oryzae TaxID=348818 RepID=UPI000B33487D|nr:hypothetical protein [Phaeacidiphilus oryzae]
MAAAGLAVLLAFGGAACSSGSGGGTGSSGTAGASSAPATSAPAAPSSGSAAQPSDPAAAKAEIVRNWEKFFNPGTPAAEKAALVQHGSAMQPVLQGFAGDPRMGQVSAKVTAVDFTGATAAKVTYTLSLKGAPVLPNAAGQSVLENGTWKVGDTTLCSLVQLSGKSVPGC